MMQIAPSIFSEALKPFSVFIVTYLALSFRSWLPRIRVRAEFPMARAEKEKNRTRYQDLDTSVIIDGRIRTLPKRVF